MSDIRAVEASPELLYVFFRSIADLPAHLVYLAAGGDLTKNQLTRIRSFSVQDFRRLRQLCPIYFRAISVTIKLNPPLMEEALRSLEASAVHPLQFGGEPTQDFVIFRALLLYVNSLPESRLDQAYALGLNVEQVRRIRQLPVALFGELHKLEPRLCTAVRMKISLAGELLDRLLMGLSVDRYQSAVQDALLARGASFELMHELYGWSRQQYDDRHKGYPAAKPLTENPGVDQLKIWVAWEETKDLPSDAERYLTVSQSTGQSLEKIHDLVSRLEQHSGRVLLGLLGEWQQKAPGRSLPAASPETSPALGEAMAKLAEQSNLPDFVHACLRLVRELTGAPGAGFLLCEPATGEKEARLVLLAAEGVSAMVAQAAKLFPLAGSFTGIAVQRRRVHQGVVTRSPEANDALIEALVSDNKIHAATVPLLDGKRAVGAINLHSAHQLDISPERATELLQLGGYIARRLNALQQPVALA